MLSQNVTLIVALFVIIAALMAITYYVSKQRTATWRRFARRHGLHFRIVKGYPNVTGTAAGRDFELFVSGRSSDTGLAGVEVVEMKLKLSSLPEGIIVEPTSGVFFDPLTTSFEDRPFLTGNDDFDRAFRVSGASEGSVTQFLTPDRQAGFLELKSASAGWVVELSDNALRCWRRGTACKVRELDEVRAHLVRAARHIDPSATVTPSDSREPIAASQMEW